MDIAAFIGTFIGIGFILLGQALEGGNIQQLIQITAFFIVAGGTAGAVLNGANEAAVAQFLAGEIGFLDIAEKVEQAMLHVPVVQNPRLDDVLEADRAAREAVR